MPFYEQEITVGGVARPAAEVEPGTVQRDDAGRAWQAGLDDNQRMCWRSPVPGDHRRDTISVSGAWIYAPFHPCWMTDDNRVAWSAVGPKDDRHWIPAKAPEAAPATDEGRVDFSELLSESWQPYARDRLNAVLGRPYLATQLAHYLPADVCHRLLDRLEGLVEREVAREVDRIHADVNEATRQTIARLAAQADQKLEELRRERFGTTSRLD